ncbi:hypothetical protein ABPG75_005354 [Micractinium tetrahymenae]
MSLPRQTAGAAGVTAVAAGLAPSCPRVAIYVAHTVLAVKNFQSFTPAVRTAYVNALKALSKGGDIVPEELEAKDESVSVHTVVLFPGPTPDGLQTAQRFCSLMLGNVTAQGLFARATFGNVHVEQVTAPYLADGNGQPITDPRLLAKTTLAGFITFAFADKSPAKVAQLGLVDKAVAAVKTRQPGITVDYTTHRKDGDWVSITGASDDAKVAVNLAISGATRPQLEALLGLIANDTKSIFPRETFGHIFEEKSGVFSMPDASYVSPCEVAITMTSAVAWGPTTGQATATSLEEAAFSLWQFTATPIAGAGVGQPVVATGPSPDVRFYGLVPNTKYEVSVAATLEIGIQVAGPNKLLLTTPSAGAPIIAAATPTSSTTATVLLNAPAAGGPVEKYIVKLCLQPAGTPCVSNTCPTITCPFDGLTPGAEYRVSAVAVVGGKTIPASNTLPLAMPARGAITLTSAVDTGTTSGHATAAPPAGAIIIRYTFTATPQDGASSVVVMSTAPEVEFANLRPSTQYTVVVVGTMSFGGTTPRSNALTFVTPAFGAPKAAGKASSPTTADIGVKPPVGGPWLAYGLTLCPVGGPKTKCVTAGPCPAATGPSACPVQGLQPGTSYVVKVVARKADGTTSPPSNEDIFTTPDAPLLTSALAWGPTTGQATASGSAGMAFASWKFLARPIAGDGASGATVPASGPAPDVRFYGLAPNTKYEVSVVGITPDGKQVPAPNKLSFTTPRAGAPVIAAATPTSPTTATILLNPPATGGPVDKYIVKLCLQPAGAPCVSNTCPTITCPFTNLSPGAEYRVSAVAVVGGKTIPASNTLPLAMPAPGAITLTSAVDTGSTTGHATAAPPAGVTITLYTFTATPLNGGEPVIVTSRTPVADFTNLSPATQYKVLVVGTTQGGGTTPPSNTLNFVTPAAGTPIAAGKALSPTAANISVQPPTGGPWLSYALTLCPVGGPQSKCVTAGPCPASTSPSACPVQGLTPSTTYVVQVTARKSDGTKSLPSNEDLFTTPIEQPRQLVLPLLTSAVAWGPTTGETTATLPAGMPADLNITQWAFTARPTDRAGAPNVTVSASSPDARFYGLMPNTTYEVTVVGKLSDGTSAAAPNKLAFKTPATGAPVIAAADPTSPTTATVLLNPPAVAPGPVDKYKVTLCEQPAGTPCVTKECPTITCPITGLTPGAAYRVSAVAVIGGSEVPAANTLPLVMPDAGAITLVRAADTGSTTGEATAVPPPAVTITQYTFTVVALNGGANLTFTSATPDVDFTGLAPATQYEVSVVGTKSTGGPTSRSNTLTFVTPAAGAPRVDASPVSPTQGSVVVTPPAGGPWSTYELVLCPVGGPAAACVQATCPAGPTPSTCPISGLTPETSYVTTVVAKNTGTGSTNPPSNEDIFTTLAPLASPTPIAPASSAPKPLASPTPIAPASSAPKPLASPTPIALASSAAKPLAAATTSVPLASPTPIALASSAAVAFASSPTQPLPSSSAVASRETLCGDTCIDPLQQCCSCNSTIGISCAGSYTNSAGTLIPAQTCSSTNGTCGCAAPYVMCGKTCIDKTTQCCTADYTIGKTCAGGQLCVSIGAACSTGSCPAGMAACGPNTAGFSVCYNTTTECCADASTSMIGTYFNGGCYAKPFCKLTYTSSSFSISIVGKYCQSKSTVCSECCIDSDCPNSINGQKCVNGFCDSNGCTTFSCMSSAKQQVCKIDGTGCADCNAVNVVRCPASTCCATVTGGNWCSVPGTNVCPSRQTCCELQSDCSNPSNLKMSGRGCSANCGSGVGADPFWQPTSFSTYGSYVYPTCPARRRMRRLAF